jgi:molybdenum cofactor cytidylyltransferase
MRRPASDSVTGLVLAAGGSRRLGKPKQLLPFGPVPLLGHVLDVARLCPFDQLLCVIGGQATRVRDEVDFEGVQVLENTQFGDGCSSSIAVALDAIGPRAEVLVLMLGDQPRVTPSTVEALLAGRGRAPLAACSYENGRGHPLAFARSTFPELAALHGDQGVWKLLDRRPGEVADIAIDGPVPLDVDTWEDYEAVLEAAPRPL